MYVIGGRIAIVEEETKCRTMLVESVWMMNRRENVRQEIAQCSLACMLFLAKSCIL